MRVLVTIQAGANPDTVLEAIVANEIIRAELEPKSFALLQTEDFLDNHEAVDFAEEVKLNFEAYAVPDAFYKITVEF